MLSLYLLVILRLSSPVFSASGGPTTNPGPNGWASLGCYSDRTQARTLQNPEPVTGGSKNMTVAGCTAKCQSLGYLYAGVEYAQECYCGNQIANGGSSISSGCNMPCAGNSSEYCGGPNALNLYQEVNRSPPANSPPGGLPINTTYLGCYSDDTGHRSLRYTYLNPGGGANLTIENCLNTCRNKGHWYAGVEYGSQCWCDDFIQPSTSTGLCIDQSRCNMPCQGNAGELCGGSSTLNIYSYNPYPDAAATCCGLPVSSSGVLQNGNFEDGLAHWNVDYLTPGSAQVDVVSGGESFSGCNSLRIRAINSKTTLAKQVSIWQTMSGLAPGAKYTTSLLSGLSTWNAPDVSMSGIAIDVSVTGRSALLYQERPCGGSSCVYKGQLNSSFGPMGDNVFVAPGSTATLYINVTWTDGDFGPNDLLIDGVIVVQGWYGN